MPSLSFSLSNEALTFVEALHLRFPTEQAAAVLDLSVWASRALHPQRWEPLRCGLERQGEAWVARLSRPENFHQFRVDVHHLGPVQPEALLQTLPPTPLEGLKQQLRGKHIVFLGCARDCATQVDASINRVAELGALFGRWQLLVFENDSTDGTAARVMQRGASLPIELLQHPGLAAALPQRTLRLALARNRLLDRARALRPDYICWLDMDGLAGPGQPGTESFLSNFQFEPCWDAVFPVNAGPYYDIWALRHPVLCDYDFMQQGAVMDAALGMPLARHFAASHLQVDWRQLQGWLPVDSAFGGMGLYKAAALEGARYNGWAEGREICEHVPFHAALRAAGRRLYLNPQFVVASHG